MRVFVAGGTGFVGRPLVQKLIERGDEVVVLSRSPDMARYRVPPSVKIVGGDPIKAGEWQKAVYDCDAVVNLVGETIVGERWTPRRKDLLRWSRIHSTRNLVDAIGRAGSKVRTLVNASAVGYYGDRGDEILTEQSGPGYGFLADLCQTWELEAERANELYHRRAVQLRIGVILGNEDGALPKLVSLYRRFLGGPVGLGFQWFPWIHLADVVGLVLLALDDSRVIGAVNAVAPEQLTMGDFAKMLGDILERPAWVRVPGLLLTAVLGESATVLLDSQRIVPEKLTQLGYKFRHPAARAALQNLLTNNG